MTRELEARYVALDGEVTWVPVTLLCETGDEYRLLIDGERDLVTDNRGMNPQIVASVITVTREWMDEYVREAGGAPSS